MKLINLEHYSELRSELNEFVQLCNVHNYKPTKSDFDEITKFILLYHSGGSTLCESIDDSVIENLYESFSLNETDANWEGDWDSAVGTIKSIGTGVAKTAAAAVATAAVGAITAGMYIKYLFKKLKVSMAVSKEKKIVMEQIKQHKKLYELKVKKWELEGKKGDVPIMELPAIK